MPLIDTTNRPAAGQAGYLPAGGGGIYGQQPGGNLNTPEYYQNQRSAMAQQSGTLGGGPLPGAFNSTPRPDQSQMISPNMGQPAAPPPGALGAMPDPNAIRRRLMGSVPGATDAAGLPYNAQFDTGVSNLYATDMAKLASYDQREGDLNTAYEGNRATQLQNQDLATKQLMDRMAFQGILSSGITTDQRALVGQKYSDILNKLAATRASGLNDVASGRLGVQSDYQQQLGNLENTYTQNLTKWVQDQAQQQAARQQQQASDAANAQLLAQIQGIQTTGNQQQMDILRQIAAAQGVTI